MSDETRITLRLPSDLQARVKVGADRSGRSMNAEIVWALEKEYPPTTIDHLVASVVETLEAASMLYGESRPDGHVNQALEVIASSLLTSVREEVSEETRGRLRKLAGDAEA